MSEHAMQAPRLREIDDLLAECQRHGMPGIMVSYAQLRALRAEVERLTVELRASETESLKHALAVGQVCIELSEEKREVERLTTERDRYKAWHDAVLAQESVSVCTTKSGDLMMIERPQPLKENE